MSPGVRFGPEAAADLDDIFGYLREQGASPSTVRKFVGRIEAQCDRMGGIPEGYPAHPELGGGIRLAPFERSAVIAYRLTDTAVEIVNVFYGGRDYAAIMQGRQDD